MQREEHGLHHRPLTRRKGCPNNNKQSKFRTRQ